MQYSVLLQKIGLSESEANIYLTSLRVGPASAIQLAKKIGMSRQIVYFLTDRLIGEGFIKEVRVGTKRLFQAVGPEILLDRASEINQNIAKAVPILKTREAVAGSIPSISVYENPIAMREWYRGFMSVAKKDEELLVWATNKTWYSVDPEFLQSFVEFKLKVGTKDRIIAPDTSTSRKFVVSHPQPNAQFRFSKNWWETDTEKWIWRDSVSFLTIRENATNLIVLRSSQLAELERFAFNQVWDGLHKN